MSQFTDAETDDSNESPLNPELRLVSYRVAVFAVPDEPEALIPILELIPEITPIDARVRLRDLPGVLPERLPEEIADAIVRELQSASVNAAKIVEKDLPRMLHQPTVHYVRCVSAGLEILGSEGTVETVLDWGDLALVSIGLVRVKHDTALTAARSADTVHGVVHGPEMWLVREGPFQAWRIDHQEMNYEYLGDRIATSAPANFRVFADDIANHAAGSYFTPSARAYLDDHRTEDAGFKSCELHAKAVQLHVLLRRTMRGAS